MTKEEWLDKAKANAKKLSNLLYIWHPASNEADFKDENNFGLCLRDNFRITASAAESACENIRNNIRQNDKIENPVQLFNDALVSEDIDQIITLLNQAWFGVPESTSCWGIEGFSEAVDLLEDPPDENNDIING